MVKQLPRDWSDSAATVVMRSWFRWGSGDLEGLGLTLVELDRLTLGVAETWQRLREMELDPPEPKDVVRRRVRLLQQRNDAHALLSYAELFWRHLHEADRRLKHRVPALRSFLASMMRIREATSTARHHFEHIDDRIKDGRAARWGTPMAKQAFREAPGQIRGSELRFADEVFDLAAIADAVGRAAVEVAPDVAQHVELKFEARIGPAPATSPEAEPDQAQ